MDSRNKRASALGFALAALVILPAPDATVIQGDRQQVAFSYAGINAGVAIAAADEGDATWTVPQRNTTWALTRSTTFDLGRRRTTWTVE